MLSFLFLIQQGSCENYFVLVAGSNTYRNYRHQSDVFQLYQILRERGMQPDKKILMAYDDIVDSSENPYPGNVYNIRKQVNIYPGKENIDYKKYECNAENFIGVLTGAGNGKVLNSTKDDDVFIFYDDHGAEGFLCFPTGYELSAQQFADAIKTMAKNNMFKRLFIVIEACYSGSVGELLNGIPNIFCITAANGEQSSYSYGYDMAIRTFRTNEFAHNFFNFILANPSKNLYDVYEYTKINTFGSDVSKFGDSSLEKAPLHDFLLHSYPVFVEYENSEIAIQNVTFPSMKSQMKYYIDRALDRSISPEERYDLLKRRDDEIIRRVISTHVMGKIASPFIESNDLNEDLKAYLFQVQNVQWKCYETTVEEFRKRCGDFSEFELKRLSMFSHLCDITDADPSPIVSRIREVCPHKMWETINY